MPMSDVDALLAKFERGEFLRPAADSPNIVDLVRALAQLAGGRGIEATPGARQVAEMIGACDHLVFVLADGLGMNLLETLPAATFLASHLAAELRTVFPSATAVALTSIATGEWPGRHGVTGWWTHLPAIGSAAALLPFVARNRSRSLAQHGVTAREAFAAPPLLERLAGDTLALFPAGIVDSVSSAYFSGGRPRRGYRTLTEAIDTIVARVGAAVEPTYTYLYWPRVDTEAHRHGLGHPRVRGALLELDRQLERLAEELDGRARLVMSADHGFLDTPAEARHPIRPTAEIMAWLRFPPSGDARVLHLHSDDGAEESLRHSFKSRYGERFLLLSLEEAERLKLFGPDSIAAEVRGRLGDLIAISRGADVIEYVRSGGPGRFVSAASHHSGLTRDEMRIPLVVA